MLLSRPLQPRTFSRRFLARGGLSPHLHQQQQREELARQKSGSIKSSSANQTVIGQDCIEPLQALYWAGPEVLMDVKALAEKQRNMDNLRRKREEAKKRQKEQKKKDRKKLKEAAKN